MRVADSAGDTRRRCREMFFTSAELEDFAMKQLRTSSEQIRSSWWWLQGNVDSAGE
ncbi:conserved hypothetical protein [Ricinus communis]|uniref:Uncharacterized protein n=1 Tax=Ricinus communis TaxID=3988 RepID=B9RMB5_RICCO|nr:conserved hypothetical protein [Ricinus communis]